MRLIPILLLTLLAGCGPDAPPATLYDVTPAVRDVQAIDTPTGRELQVRLRPGNNQDRLALMVASVGDSRDVLSALREHFPDQLTGTVVLTVEAPLVDRKGYSALLPILEFRFDAATIRALPILDPAFDTFGLLENGETRALLEAGAAAARALCADRGFAPRAPRFCKAPPEAPAPPAEPDVTEQPQNTR